MEIHKCIVRGCANKSDAIIHYSLPEDPQRREQWIRFISGSNPGQQIPDVSRLCGDHFPAESFTKLDLGFTTRLILNLDAVPTIYSTDKTSAYRRHLVSTESRKGTGMLEVKMVGIKEDTEWDSQVNRWNNSFCSVSESFSSIKEEDVGDDESIAETFGQIRVVKIEDLLNGERRDERGVEYSNTHPNKKEEEGCDAMVTQIDGEEKMMEQRRVREQMMEKVNLTEHQGEVEEVFVIENSNPEEDGWREFVVGQEEWCMEGTGARRMEEAGERGMEGMWVRNPRGKKPQWWRYELERKKTEEDEWKMIAERAREEQKGQAVEEKKRVAGFHCPHCSNTFQSRSDLLEHKTSCCADPANTSLAPVGPKRSPAKETQSPRQKSKMVEVQSLVRKTFYCPLCNKYYKSQNLLDKHARSHTSLRNVTFRCSFCPLEFPKKIEIRKHYDADHPHEVPHCEDCRKTFSSVQVFLNHQVRHLTVTPYYCYECHIYQTTQRGLTVHLRNHALRGHNVRLGGLTKPVKTESCGTDPLVESPFPQSNNPALVKQEDHVHGV